MTMLSLKSPSSQRWLNQVDEHLDEILIDHAHCEKKAAGCAMNLIFAYVENYELCQEMIEIVNEELEHFHMVIEILESRSIRFCRLRPGDPHVWVAPRHMESLAIRVERALAEQLPAHRATLARNSNGGGGLSTGCHSHFSLRGGLKSQLITL